MLCTGTLAETTLGSESLPASPVRRDHRKYITVMAVQKRSLTITIDHYWSVRESSTFSGVGRSSVPGTGYFLVTTGSQSLLKDL